MKCFPIRVQVLKLFLNCSNVNLYFKWDRNTWPRPDSDSQTCKTWSYATIAMGDFKDGRRQMIRSRSMFDTMAIDARLCCHWRNNHTMPFIPHLKRDRNWLFDILKYFPKCFILYKSSIKSSFENEIWERHDNRHAPSAEDLAEAGFYFVGGLEQDRMGSRQLLETLKTCFLKRHQTLINSDPFTVRMRPSASTVIQRCTAGRKMTMSGSNMPNGHPNAGKFPRRLRTDKRIWNEILIVGY